MKKILIGALVLAAMYFASIENWQGYAYPDKNNLFKVIELGKFKTEADCNAAAIKTLQSVSSISAGDYECHKD